MDQSPFKYGVTVCQMAFTDREKDAKKLYDNLTQGINTMLISPRRWGKSSLVEKVVKDINKKEKRIKTIVIDLFSVGSEEEFLEMFAKEVIKASSSKWEEWVVAARKFFKQLVPRINMGVDPFRDFSLSFDWEGLRQHQEEILNLPEELATQKNIQFIICLDEFQNLASYPDYEILEKKMRAHWQRHKKVTYCLYGSKRHMMTDIFNNPSKPFYRFGDIMLLQKISTADWVSFIVKSFKKTGKTIDKQIATLIPELMKDHSWYVQQLAHYTWQLTGEKAEKSFVYKALEELIFANTPLYQKEVEVLSPTQLNLLKAVVQGEHQLTSTAVMERYRLGTPRNVSKNKTILFNNDVIQETGSGYEFLDPAFQLWFLKQYFRKDYLP
ncbi:ATP-binding protein [Litoribacter ruber]|uniref:ATP-binding protein n=1 Tax=Litoribacter ruber TaxID=702568 RepID=A0AAP2CFJ5_9BACT|nr:MULTISPECIES: ATP-binding protein [Litoribacter]MBS9523653.1 ATP-binding protein [Litoribacter alkaliphilus]MBT0812167.1 ATP-binding protein [Litoribacter ruber]